MIGTAGETNSPPGFITSSPACEIPAKACDCHTHVFGHAKDYPLSRNRHYNPPPATPRDLQAMLATTRFDRVVLVQPSAYGADNRCLMDALSHFGQRARGIAVITPDMPREDLLALHDAGVRGCRINAPQTSAADLHKKISALRTALGRIEKFGWHVQFMVSGAHLATIERFLSASRLRIVLDHFGGPAAPDERTEDRIAALRRLLESGRCWIKLSGPHRTGRFGDSQTIQAMTSALARGFPGRLLWGSDWPHTAMHGHRPVAGPDVSPFQKLDTGKLVDTFVEMVGSKILSTQILRDNPDQLFQWDT